MEFYNSLTDEQKELYLDLWEPRRGQFITDKDTQQCDRVITWVRQTNNQLEIADVFMNVNAVKKNPVYLYQH